MSSKRMIGYDPLLRVEDSFEGMMDPELVLLLHGWGGDATTNILDSSPSRKTVTVVGGAQIDTAQSVFGGSSILFNGAGAYLSVPDSADWSLSGDFMLGVQGRFAALPTAGNSMAFATQRQDDNNYWEFYVENSGGTYRIRFYVISGGVTLVNLIKNTSPNLSIDTWYDFELDHSGTSWLIFQDGPQIGTTTTDADTVPDFAGPLYVGSYGTSADFMNGWLAEVLMLKGKALHTTNYTVPTTPYYAPNSRWSMFNTGGAAAIDVHGDALQIQAASDIAATIRYVGVQYLPLSGFVGTGPSVEITGYMQLPSEGTANLCRAQLLLYGDASNYVDFYLYDNAGTYTRNLDKVVAGSGTTIKTETLAHNLISYSPLVRIWIDATNIRVDLDGVQWLAKTAHGLTFPQNQFYVTLRHDTSRTTVKTVVFDDFQIRYNPLPVA